MLYIRAGVRVCLAMGHNEFWIAQFQHMDNISSDQMNFEYSAAWWEVATLRAFGNGEVLKDYTSKSPFMGIICVQFHDINSLGSLQRNRADRKSWGDFSYSPWSLCMVILPQENHGFLLLQSPDSSHLRFWESVLTSGLSVAGSSQPATMGAGGSSWFLLKDLLSLSSIPQETILSCPDFGLFSSCSSLRYVGLRASDLHPVKVSIPFYWLKSDLEPCSLGYIPHSWTWGRSCSNDLISFLLTYLQVCCPLLSS